MSSLNRCEFIGRLGADPEVRMTQGNNKVVNLRLAVSEKWKDRQSGEEKERTTWVSIVIWSEGLANVAERYLRKGSQCYVAGALETRKWQDQSGNDRYNTEIVLRGFDSKLVLLGDRNGGDRDQSDDRGSGGGYNGGRDNGGGYGNRDARGGRDARDAQPSRGGSGSSRRTVAEDLDDDIPF